MADVRIDGVFMGADVKTSSWDGKDRSAIYIDVYQPETASSEKSLQIKCNDLSLINTLSKEYAMGSAFSCVAQVNAYKNKAYFSLVKLA